MRFPWNSKKEEFVPVSLEDLMEDIFKPEPWYCRAWWEIHNRPTHVYRDVRHNVRTWVQRAFRGYADIDVWDHYSQASDRAVKSLTALMENGHGITGEEPGIGCFQGVSLGTPEDENARGPWVAKIRKMIYFHKVCAGYPIPRNYSERSSIRREKARSPTH